VAEFRVKVEDFAQLARLTRWIGRLVAAESARPAAGRCTQWRTITASRRGGAGGSRPARRSLCGHSLCLRESGLFASAWPARRCGLRTARVSRGRGALRGAARAGRGGVAAGEQGDAGPQRTLQRLARRVAAGAAAAAVVLECAEHQEPAVFEPAG